MCMYRFPMMNAFTMYCMANMQVINISETILFIFKSTHIILENMLYSDTPAHEFKSFHDSGEDGHGRIHHPMQSAQHFAECFCLGTKLFNRSVHEPRY